MARNDVSGPLKVLILTQASCGFCNDAKAIVDRLSKEHRLSVSTVSLDSAEGRALAARGGIMFPPGIFIDGDPFSYGRLSERKLRREIARRLATQSVDAQDAAGAS
jgi:glutaredoxin